MNLIDRFLKYVSYHTTSDEETGTTPSTPRQMAFAHYLVEDLKSIGLIDAEVDRLGYVFATLPATTTEDLPTIGLIAHMDTSPDMSGKDVKPRIVKNYDGENITLNANQNIILNTTQFPEILQYKGQDIIVTDGLTLLGADDKAGIAEIVSAAEYLIQHPEIKHGRIRLGFNPDEEIGQGAWNFDVKKFDCEWAYTFDGGEIGEFEYENFNAASASITFKGLNVHPGYAYKKMRNAIHMAMDFASSLPKNETPETTQDYEGFFHLIHTSGTVEEAKLTYIVRDHDRKKFEDRKVLLQNLAKKMNQTYQEELVTIELKDQYYNMREKVEPLKHILDLALSSMKEAGVEPNVKPIRGGTDGAQLSFKGLPCPNIFTGGHNFHGRYEFIPIQSMEKAMNVCLNIIKNVKPI